MNIFNKPCCRESFFNRCEDNPTKLVEQVHQQKYFIDIENGTAKVWIIRCMKCYKKWRL